jgi:protein-tyrosine phosphatase
VAEAIALREGPIWIDGAGPGKLAIIPRPRGGDWLPDEVRSWTRSGLDIVVSLLTPDEERELGLEGEAAESRAVGLEFKSFPIPDRGVPLSRRDALRFLDTLATQLEQGKALGVHCRQGIGRSALVAASLLALKGVPPVAALERIGVARGRDVPETPEQRRWVEELSSSALTTADRVSEGSAGSPPSGDGADGTTRCRR